MIITYRCWLIFTLCIHRVGSVLQSGNTKSGRSQVQPYPSLKMLTVGYILVDACVCFFFWCFCCLRLRAFNNVWTLLYRGLSLYRGPGPQTSHFWVRILRGIYFIQYTVYILFRFHTDFNHHPNVFDFPSHPKDHPKAHNQNFSNINRCNQFAARWTWNLLNERGSLEPGRVEKSSTLTWQGLSIWSF